MELDPEKDPVIYTTDYGLEIKSHNAAGLPDITVNDPTGKGTIATQGGTTWNYISAGGYNWIIIGQYSSSSYSFNPSPLAGNMYSGNNPDGTDAGNAIESASENGLLQAGTITIPAFTNAVVPSNGEIPIGCVLCLAASKIGSATDAIKFNEIWTLGNNYKGSNLEKFINETIYGGTSILSMELQGLPIVPQKLTTLYYNYATSIIENAYVFPLAGYNNTESFYINTYLDTKTKRTIIDNWWLRTGFVSYAAYAYSIDASGDIFYDRQGYGYSVDTLLNLRPAFVLRLY